MREDGTHLDLSPSDVTAFLACEHLTTLSLAHDRAEIERPEVQNEQAELIFREGLEDEHAYLESLRARGLTVLEIPDHEGDFETAALATAHAIRAGDADVIYPGVVAHENWRAVADFLMRQPDGTYEALDTKLVRSAKPAYILHLLFYNEQLARIQNREPNHIHVLLGNGEQVAFRPGELAAYYRRVRSRLKHFVAEPSRRDGWFDLAKTGTWFWTASTLFALR
jgi:predicted RecB family nuclease